jgi:hypothetical protein
MLARDEGISRLTFCAYRKTTHLRHPSSDRALGNFQVVRCLQIQPVLRRLPESLAQQKGDFRGDGAGSPNNMGNPHGRNPDKPGKHGLRYAQLLQGLPQEDTGMDGRQSTVGNHGCTSGMVIDDFDLKCIAVFEIVNYLFIRVKRAFIECLSAFLW